MAKNGKEFLSFLKMGGDPEKPHAIAGHFADRISALELNLGSARREGDTSLMEMILIAMGIIREEATDLGLSKDDYPGLYK